MKNCGKGQYWVRTKFENTPKRCEMGSLLSLVYRYALYFQWFYLNHPENIINYSFPEYFVRSHSLQVI